jgi:hypothetical protein
MSSVDTYPSDPPGAFRHVQWGPVIAGAAAAAALAFVLHAFAIGMGIGVSSTAPTWRDASFALVLLAGLYLVLASLVAYGLGGYLATRLTRWPATGVVAETEFRDGVHGILVWAIATLLTAVLAWGTLQAGTRLAAPSGGTAGPSASVGGENLIAFDLDRLLRSDRRAGEQGDINYARAEAARILFTASSHRGMLPEDRAYLVRLVGSRTGLAQADAERRVQDVIVRAKENIDRARRSAVLLAFMAGAAALLGAAAACCAGWAGGRHRDGVELSSPNWDLWGPLGPARS